jgi:transcriptional regulator GlxA family with amidase domain
MSYSAAVEPLRAANILAGATLYRWWHATPDNKPVAASNGISVLPGVAIGDVADPPDLLLVCAGGNPTTFSHGATFAWLRHLARRGSTVGGISGGPYLLAKAGLLNGRRCTLHWEHVPAFQQTFPAVTVTQSLFEIDNDRITCSGGIAALDMMVALVARKHGHELASRIGEWFVHTQFREEAAPQRVLAVGRGVGNTRLSAVLRLMERHVERPLPRRKLAVHAGVSLRQLDRMFRDYLGHTVQQHYLHLRLDKARALLRETNLPMLDISLATGFASASQFSRTYKRAFGHAPSRDALRFLRRATTSCSDSSSSGGYP